MIYWFWLVVCCCVYCEPRHSHLFTQQIWEIYAKSIAWKMDTSLALHKRSHHRIVYSYGDDEQTLWAQRRCLFFSITNYESRGGTMRISYIWTREIYLYLMKCNFSDANEERNKNWAAHIEAYFLCRFCIQIISASITIQKIKKWLAIFSVYNLFLFDNRFQSGVFFNQNYWHNDGYGVWIEFDACM